jgi:hypothetical protein
VQENLLGWAVVAPTTVELYAILPERMG